MRPERHPLAQIVVAPHQLPKEPSLLPRANLLQPDLAQIPRRAHQSGARLSPCRHRYLGRFPPAAAPAAWGATPAPPWLSSFSRNSRHSRALSDPLRRFHPSNSPTVAASSIRLRPHTSPRSPGSGPAPLRPPPDLGNAALSSPLPLPQTYASKPTNKCPVPFPLLLFFIAPGFHRLRGGRVSGQGGRVSERTAIRRVLADLCPLQSLISPQSAARCDSDLANLLSIKNNGSF